MKILFATSNEHKVRMVESRLGRPLHQVQLDLPEIQAVDVQDVIEQKTLAAYQLTGEPVLVEDTSLSFTAWNGLPGALIRWFLETVGNEGICRMLADYDDLEAQAETCLGYFDGLHFAAFSGVVKGQISRRPRGDNGFGWDPIFIPRGWTKTFAEMTIDDKANFVSMRTEAVLRLKAYLDMLEKYGRQYPV
ncbi:MAG: non-canonical purine NTP pyrophosphatase [Candidatus Promineifilaceae bacterium]|nr:non-canonical purine NTP pyrophosphatase [Candidatus Promineifilaceae bacterium]